MLLTESESRQRYLPVSPACAFVITMVVLDDPEIDDPDACKPSFRVT
jgi:hypothetical protein